MTRLRYFLLLLGCFALSACDANQAVEPLPPTATLAPIVSLTPRFTATPIPSRTPLPTTTLTPSESPIPPTPSDTPTPTETPPVLGSVVSLNDVNMREGPGVSFPAISALAPGTGFTIVATDTTGGWYNVRLDDGDEGWISATLVRVQPSPTPIPSLTPTPDLTLMAQGSPLPTSLLGGEPITPTPPRSVATPSPVGESTEETEESEGVALPNLEAIARTATALVEIGLPVSEDDGTERPLGGPTGGPLSSGTSTSAPSGSASTQGGVDVLAYCDDPSYGSPPPSNLAAGSTIDIFWSWYASTRELIREHLDAVSYDVRLDGEPLSNWRQFAVPIRQEGGRYYQYWFVPTEPLSSGEHRITYTVTWSRAISDGFDEFGPGTANPSQSGSCTFTVR
jgi:hypothetical protein